MRLVTVMGAIAILNTGIVFAQSNNYIKGQLAAM